MTIVTIGPCTTSTSSVMQMTLVLLEALTQLTLPCPKTIEDGALSPKHTMSTSQDSTNEEVSYKERREYPALYKTDAVGNERVWKVWTVDNTVHKIYGVVDGNHRPNERTFAANNQLSANEKAWAEATKCWINSVEKGYAPKSEEGLEMLDKLQVEQAKSGGHNINAVSAISGARKKKTLKREKKKTLMVADVTGGIFIPMKTKVWDVDDSGEVKYSVAKYFSGLGPKPKGKPAPLLPTDFYGQPKLDGWRARVLYQKNSDGEYEIAITSNSGKQYPWFASMRLLLLSWLNRARVALGEEVFAEAMLSGLDGEMYVKEIVDTEGTPMSLGERFSAICSICGLSRSEPHALEDQMQYHIFDLADSTGMIEQHDRFRRLDLLFACMASEESARLVRVDTEVLSSTEEVSGYHYRCIEDGYEGAILRAHTLLYQTKRANNMRKLKNFMDAEYEVVGAQLDPGVATEQFVWICRVTTKGADGEGERRFKAKPVGTREAKLEIYERRADYYGRLLCVKFQELTEDGVPRFPIAKEFREAGDV